MQIHDDIDSFPLQCGDEMVQLPHILLGEDSRDRILPDELAQIVRVVVIHSMQSEAVHAELAQPPGQLLADLRLRKTANPRDVGTIEAKRLAAVVDKMLAADPDETMGAGRLRIEKGDRCGGFVRHRQPRHLEHHPSRGAGVDCARDGSGQ